MPGHNIRHDLHYDYATWSFLIKMLCYKSSKLSDKLGRNWNHNTKSQSEHKISSVTELTLFFSSAFSSVSSSTFFRNSVTSSLRDSTSAVSGPSVPMCCLRKSRALLGFSGSSYKPTNTATDFQYFVMTGPSYSTTLGSTDQCN